MFVGQTVMCLVEVILCAQVSSHNPAENTRCKEYTAQRPAMCKVVDMFDLDYKVVEVNCGEFLKTTKKYTVALNNKGNFENQEVSQELCDESIVID